MNENCNETHIKFMGVAAHPSSECYNVLEHTKEYTKLQETGTNKYLWTGPIWKASNLSDGSRFSMSNYIKGECKDN